MLSQQSQLLNGWRGQVTNTELTGLGMGGEGEERGATPETESPEGM